MNKQVHKPDQVTEETDREERKRRIDLSAPQVAGSAVAAVVAAKLASNMGVYGTVLGAGVISVIATCGGSVFQHLFSRTGEQVRGAKEQVGARSRRPTRTGAPADAAADGRFGAATTYGTRVRGWKRSAVAAALVFLVAMAGITTYELATGQDFSGGKGTTVGSVVRGGQPAPQDGGSGDGRQHEQDGDGDGVAPSGSPDPGRSGDTGGRNGGGSPDPGRSPSGSATDGTTPGPGDTAGGEQEQQQGGSGDGGTSPAPEESPAPSGSSAPEDPSDPSGRDGGGSGRQPGAPQDGGAGQGAATPPANGGAPPAG
ncbi:hypothetical protein [Streptomyces sp. ODS05-4]|uniref:hypothetical protein n=1 Tax=Streptomyces sp. ODS05-4 TaxID=2944939 RepID=UPI00210E1DA1|nr:hypothetical protein [Streptomyces sp. ODS05-4]